MEGNWEKPNIANNEGEPEKEALEYYFKVKLENTGIEGLNQTLYRYMKAGSRFEVNEYFKTNSVVKVLDIERINETEYRSHVEEERKDLE